MTSSISNPPSFPSRRKKKEGLPYQEMYPLSFFRFNYPPDGLPVTIPVFGAQKGSF